MKKVEMHVEYNTGNYEKYKSKNPLKRAMVNRLNERIIGIVGGFVGENSEIKILDAGCGEGFIDHLILQRYPGTRITGLEYTSEALEIAKVTNLEAKYVQGDICDLPFEDDSFDYVICTEVLEHLQNPEIALNEILRVCKNDILITVPYEPWFCLGNFLVLKNVTRLGNPIDHINHWTKSSFNNFLQRNTTMGGVES